MEKVANTARISDQDGWTQRAILYVARVRRFSSDRTIREYTKGISSMFPVCQ